MIHRKAALGEAFSGVGAQALSLLGCCRVRGGPVRARADISPSCPTRRWSRSWAPQPGRSTQDHLDHSPCCSIEKAQRLLGYAPRYTTEQIYVECLEYLLERGNWWSERLRREAAGRRLAAP